MDNLQIFAGQRLAGTLQRDLEGITFRYMDGYTGPPVFMSWPLRSMARHWRDLPAELSCLLPQGLQLGQWRDSGATDLSDWGLLASMGADLPGMVSVLPTNSKATLMGRGAVGLKQLNRARIVPGINALPHTAREVAVFCSETGFTHSLASRAASVNAIYSRKDSSFKLVKTNGRYRLTVEPKESPGMVANQLLTSRLAHDAGLLVAQAGKIQTNDGVPVMWVERFDRFGASNIQRLRTESACQLLGQPPVAKYDGTVESIAQLIRQHCTNPKIQLMRLFHRLLFGWLTGNSGLHLKKWSFLQNGSIVELSPAYGLINDAILSKNATESALLIDNRREGLDRQSLLNYLGEEVCELNPRMIARVMKQLKAVRWEQRISESGLSTSCQRAYFELISERWLQLQR